MTTASLSNSRSSASSSGTDNRLHGGDRPPGGGTNPKPPQECATSSTNHGNLTTTTPAEAAAKAKAITEALVAASATTTATKVTAPTDATAIAYWERLLPQLEPGSNVAASVQQQLDIARGRLGVAPSGDGLAETGSAAPWGGIEVRVDAPDNLPALSPEAALFIIARDPAAPNPPLGAVRLTPAFPAQVTVTDANSMMPQRPISASGEIEFVARLALDGNPLSTDAHPESAPVTVSRDASDPVTLTLELP